MEVCFESSFERDLKKIRDRRLLKRVKETIYEVKRAGNSGEVRNLSKLIGYKSFYRIRIGDYRMGIDLVKDKIIFTRFLHRKEIYKYFP
ncbi:MAG: type II toxin-antitoxin system RelE/ParE family toxin [Deltaproteobacteria bacterium]|nr:type II toxin-antitoxin system RelE/ParE family toxin [Deltaproteobacteria bacterium]MBW1939683.1 type II toxin-antitoxin system RelE/ParE family toxin [Deltaproteobacteria bacterium]MBW1965603.1 type II toxin-antitoxin system RelE/ParE family toxin [Deltaproteobacteria bacterium]MBW2081364.1 type II toxin-antitoxin system RelE/ParE family toxin [Deltaproteobacteria bacterium]